MILVPTQLYMKNYQIKNWICFVAFFFPPFGLHRTHILCPFFFLINSFAPFVLMLMMLMMLRFGPFRERGKRGERERIGETV